MKNTVGKNIVKLRKEQGMSQEQLAQKLHVTRQAPLWIWRMSFSVIPHILFFFHRTASLPWTGP